jgi:ABC-type glycerol-3-phosphate transport system substrate-binding protein
MLHKRISKLILVLALFSIAVGVRTPAQAQDVTLVFWNYFVTQAPALDKAIAAFEKANPGIKIKSVVTETSQYLNALNLAYQSDGAPDFFWTPDQSKLSLQQMVTSGWVLPISDFPDFAEFMKPYPEGALEPNKNVIDGKTYGVPFGGGSIAGPFLQFFVHKGIYKEAGLVNADGSYKLPTTWAEVAANSKVIKEKTGKFGLGFGSNAMWQFPWLCQLSGGYSSDGQAGRDPKTGKFTFSTNPCYKSLIQSLVTMRDDKLVLPNVMSIDDENARVRFGNGEFAHLLNGTWIVNGWEKTNPNFKQEDWTSVSLPLIVGDKQTSKFYLSGIGGSDFFINANTKQKDAAWKFFKFLNTPEVATIWAETNNGVLRFAPGDPTKFAKDDASKLLLASAGDVILGPSPSTRNPDTAKVQVTLQGPGEIDIITGAFTGQIKDIDAALADLDKRLEDAFVQGLSDAQAAGAKVTREDFVFADWDPLKPYVTVPAAK